MMSESSVIQRSAFEMCHAKQAVTIKPSVAVKDPWQKVMERAVDGAIWVGISEAISI